MLFRDFLAKIESEGKVVKITKPVSTRYEMAAVMKSLDGKPIFFENVEGFGYKVAANVISTRDLLAESIGVKKEDMIRVINNAIDRPKKPETIKPSGYEEVPPDLKKLPILTYYKEDGGPYIASAIVVASDEEYGLNSSFHRMMVLSKNEVVARVVPRHLNEYLKRGLKRFAICIGNPTQVLLASAISVEIGKSELSIANAISETRLIDFDGILAPESEFVMIAEVTGKTAKEGPFLDLTETPDIVREQPVFKITKIFSRKNPFFHALLPGGFEHKILMGVPREPTIFREVNKVCRCKNVVITPGGCSWLHAIVQIEKRRPDDGKKAIEAAFQGHKSLKHVVVVDEDIDIYNPNDVEWAIATRFQADKNLVIKPKEKGSSLDPSSNLQTTETTKVGIDATIPSDRRKSDFLRLKPSFAVNIEKYTR
ncbi:MAG: UbiD family decarboxylase [Candidatus Aenigmatarchaeota archaeon]